MTELKTQRDAIEALAKWYGDYVETELVLAEQWAADYYASLMRENVAASERHEWHLTDQVKHAVKLTHATIQSLVEGASDE